MTNKWTPVICRVALEAQATGLMDGRRSLRQTMIHIGLYKGTSGQTNGTMISRKLVLTHNGRRIKAHADRQTTILKES